MEKNEWKARAKTKEIKANVKRSHPGEGNDKEAFIRFYSLGFATVNEMTPSVPVKDNHSAPACARGASKASVLDDESGKTKAKAEVVEKQ